MEKESDDLEKTKAAYPSLFSCSFDKGFHSPENQRVLKDHLEVVALKRKGKLSQKVREIEASEEFKKAQHRRAAVESAINGLEVHGLDKCRDDGIAGFKRYVAFAVVTRNIHRIGTIIHQRIQKQLKRQKDREFKGMQLLAA